MTTGTYEFLKKMKLQHQNENMIIMQNADTSLLLHETEGNTLFNEPRRYEVIDASGSIQKQGYVIFNNIPVTDEGRPVFEYRFKNRARLIEEVAGFVALRVLRPLSNDTYIIMTLWEDEESFKGWQNSQQYNKGLEKRGSAEGIDQQKNIFSAASYVSEYMIPEEETE